MNALVMTMIFVVTTVAYSPLMGHLPGLAKLLPELISGCALILVVVYGTRNRFEFVRPAYWLIFGTVVVTMVCGVLANSVGSGPLVAGMRRYLSPLPLFFLPAVYAFSERQIRKQLLLVLILCLPQLPIALAQRARTSAQPGNTSGDFTVGTLGTSGLLSIFLICAACVLAAAFLKKRIKLALFLPLFILVLLPTTINETKVTVVLLPIGLLTTFIAGSQRGARIKNAVLASGLLVMFGAIFIPIYDFYAGQSRHPSSIVDFFSDENAVDRYLSKNADVGATNLKQTGRADAILIPLREMARDPTHFVFGLGIGNASQSSLGPQFNGEYFDKFAPFLRSAASLFILEVGLLGLGCAFAIDYLIYRDSRAVADTDDSVIGTLAIGWAGVTVVIMLATPYANIASSEAIAYLFWYFSGVIGAHRVRLSHQRALSYSHAQIKEPSTRLQSNVAMRRLQGQ